MPKLTPQTSPLRLDSNQAAAYLGVSPATLNAWRTRGHPHIPYYRIGGKVIYDRADLDAYRAKHRVSEPPEAAR